jgi:hypothetical protein
VRHAEARLQQRENIYDLVARESARRGVPREKLLIQAFRAVVNDELSVDFNGCALDERMPQGTSPRQSLRGMISTIEREPTFFVFWFRLVTVDIQLFDRWLRNTDKLPPGPKHGETGWSQADRNLFPEMQRLIVERDLRSPYAAALELVRIGKVAGSGAPESKAKRLASRFRKWRHNWPD